MILCVLKVARKYMKWAIWNHTTKKYLKMNGQTVTYGSKDLAVSEQRNLGPTFEVEKYRKKRDKNNE